MDYWGAKGYVAPLSDYWGGGGGGGGGAGTPLFLRLWIKNSFSFC